METQSICPNCRKPLPPDVPLGLCPECLIKSGFPTGTEPGVSGEVAGARFVPPTVEEITRLFPQFEILGFIGKGGMGAVYKARQPALDRFVALKVLPPAVAGDPGFAERFNREARALARLNHPNIVAVHDFGKTGTLHYLVMEFVDGTNLREVEHAGRLSPEQALAIVPQICEALQFAHNEGIVHRDIKPENLLMDKKGRVKITDFGIAKIVGVTAGKSALTGVKDVVGTPHYMAPEQIEQPQTVDHRADIYSLGVVFYEMLTGELPLGKFAPPSKKVQIDVRLDEVVLHTLEKEPSRRYQQANQLKTDVETIAAGGAKSGVRSPKFEAGQTPAAAGQATSDKIILPAFLLAFPFGLFGAHRFYVGKIWTASLQLAAFGGCVLLIIACATLGERGQPVTGILLGFLILGCFIWATIDWILILCKAFTDGQGRRITHWVHPSTASGMKTVVPPLTGPPPTLPPGGVAPSAAGLPPAPMAPAKAPTAGTGKIVAPAVGLMVAAGWKLFSALKAIFFLTGPGSVWINRILEDVGVGTSHHWGVVSGFSIVFLQVIPALLILFGGFQMVQLRSYAWAVAAAILAIVCCSLVGFPVGIWALIILARQDVRETFARAAASPSPKTGSKWPWILGAAAVAGVIVLGLILAVVLALRLANGNPGAAVRGTVPGQSVAGARAEQTDESRMPQQAVPVPTGTHTINVPLTNDGSITTVSNLLSPDGRFVIVTNRIGPAAAKQAAVAPAVQSEARVQRTKIIGNLLTNDEFEQDFSQTLPLAAHGRLALDNVNGRVEISGWDRDEVVIQAVKHGKARDSVEALEIQVDAASDHVNIRTRQPESWFGWKKDSVNVDYTIRVPQKARLEKISSVNGSVAIEGVSGDIEASSVNGRVEIHGAVGDLKLSTVNGGIEAGLASLGHDQSVSLTAVNGHIEAILPANADAEVSASTVNGGLSSEFPSLVVKKEFPVGGHLKGTLGNGGASVKATTVNGGINFRKGADAK